jgi:hypothetical protein
MRIGGLSGRPLVGNGNYKRSARNIRLASIRVKAFAAQVADPLLRSALEMDAGEEARLLILSGGGEILERRTRFAKRLRLFANRRGCRVQ